MTSNAIQITLAIKQFYVAWLPYIEHVSGVLWMCTHASMSVYIIVTTRLRSFYRLLYIFTFMCRKRTASGVCACPIYKMRLVTLERIQDRTEASTKAMTNLCRIHLQCNVYFYR